MQVIFNFIKKKIILFFFINLIFSNFHIYFIYNANNDFLSIISDFIHKEISPKSYPCELCSLSYGSFTKKDKWKEFLSELNYEYSFIYKNETHGLEFDEKKLPMIIIKSNEETQILVTKEELKKCSNVDDLINLIKYKLTFY